LQSPTMRLPPSIDRRQALLRALVGLTAGRLSFDGARPANAIYTVVSTGSIASRQAQLVEVTKKFAAKPDDPYIFGEKAQLEFDVAALERNKAFATQLSKDVAAGRQSFYQALRVGVPNMQEAVTFWTRGCGALVLDTRLVGGANVTRVGFGPQSFGQDDGAKFALELVEGASSSYEADGPLQYVQLAIPVFRLSQVMQYGGEITSAYGWTAVNAPGGLPLRVHIDNERRDPFEFVALRASNLKSAVAHYEELGFVKVDEKTNMRKLEFSINKNTIFENADATEVDREVGSILMGTGDKATNTGVLLLPPDKKKTRAAAADPMPPVMRFVGGTALAERPGPDGVVSIFEPPADFEAAWANKIPTALSTDPLLSLK